MKQEELNSNEEIPKSQPKAKSGENGNGNGENKGTWYYEYKKIFEDVIDLRDGLDRYGTITSIRKNLHLKGINVWLLICSIMVASIGLDQSSVAVIIGGMLISPLMYPILGLGLSIAMNDQENFVVSLKNFSVATAVALGTSFIYFLVTPFGLENAEILARTQPDVRDVFVGFFGGIAGIVAGSRKDVSSAIPGVAIATALLPPVCVAGYGLANFNLAIFGGAFYLFILNTFFIMIATFLVVRYLKFPYKQHASEKLRKKAQYYIASASFLIIIPSFFFLFNSLKAVREKNDIRRFVEDNFERNNHINVINWGFEKKDTVNVLSVTCQIDDKLSEAQEDSLALVMAKNYKLKNVKLKLTQIEATEDEMSQMRDDQTALKTDVEKALEQFTLLINEKDKKIDNLEDEVLFYQADSIMFNDLKDKLKIFYEDIDEIYFGQLWHSDFNKEQKQIWLILEWKKRLYKSVLDERTEILTNYVMSEFKHLDTVYVKHQ